jgi:predicted RNA binding protein YcfA (HicA-like mRNA interferase family)
MPRKIRELRRDLRRAGYYQVKGGGKGSHEKWKHPLVGQAVTLAGADGDDAAPYKERQVAAAVAAAREAERRQKKP